jgi:hypothetical protein
MKRDLKNPPNHKLKKAATMIITVEYAAIYKIAR